MFLILIGTIAGLLIVFIGIWVMIEEDVDLVGDRFERYDEEYELLSLDEESFPRVGNLNSQQPSFRPPRDLIRNQQDRYWRRLTFWDVMSSDLLQNKEKAIIHNWHKQGF